MILERIELEVRRNGRIKKIVIKKIWYDIKSKKKVYGMAKYSKVSVINKKNSTQTISIKNKCFTIYHLHFITIYYNLTPHFLLQKIYNEVYLRTLIKCAMQ